MMNFNIAPVEDQLKAELKNKLDNKTKPPGSMGILEDIAVQAGMVQNTLFPSLNKPQMLVFAGDHGVVEERVSAYPQEVTAQMVKNFLSGGAAINVLCRQHQIAMKVIDAGVKEDLPDHPELINAKTGYGTANFANGPAMNEQQFDQAMQNGADIVDQINNKGCNIVAFGEMGIGNTSSASVLASLMTVLPLEYCTGGGTGMNQAIINHKMDVLSAAIGNYNDEDHAASFLRWFGGFEMVMMCGAMLKAAEKKMIILVDGFICTSVFVVANALYPALRDYCIFSHESAENGHKHILSFMEAEPLLYLDMRLGEGTGAAMAYPVVQSAVNILNEMASFDEAGVSNKV